MIIVLDPGHGGKDPGAVNPDGTTEKELNLQQALSIYFLGTQRGLSFRMTRYRDVYVPLAERVHYAKDIKAGLFLSVHHDTPTARSAGVYHRTGHGPSEGLARQLAVALDGWLRPSSASRFGRLYIDDFPGTAVLVEFGPTEKVERDTRIARAEKVLSVLADWVVG